MWILGLLLQASVSGPALPEIPATSGTAPACPEGSNGEIVVCKRPTDPLKYRLPRVENQDVTILPKADFGLVGKMRGSIHATQRSLGPMSAPAAMFTLSVPF